MDVNGHMAHPVFKFLKSKLKGSLGNFIKWNYAKVCVAMKTLYFPPMTRFKNFYNLDP